MHERRARHDGGGDPRGDPFCPGRHELVDGVRKRGDPEHDGHKSEEAFGPVTDVVDDTLGHAGGPARVNHHLVIVSAGDPRRRLRTGQDVFVAFGFRAGRRTVVDLGKQLQRGYALGDAAHGLAQRGVEDQRLGVGVLEQVDELVVDVAVVDIDGDHPCL